MIKEGVVLIRELFWRLLYYLLQLELPDRFGYVFARSRITLRYVVVNEVPPVSHSVLKWMMLEIIFSFSIWGLNVVLC